MIPRHERILSMHGSPHPTPKTLAAKLRTAKTALEAGRFVVVDANRHVKADLEELGVDVDTYYELIREVVEAALVSPSKCYAGGHPPQRSTTHAAIKNLELWAFQVEVPAFSFPLYFKFALKPHPTTGETYTYCHVDCHPSKKPA